VANIFDKFIGIMGFGDDEQEMILPLRKSRKNIQEKATANSEVQKHERQT
jgi:hypothetical protein